MEMIIKNASQIVLVVAILCTLISIITEFTKEIGFLKKVPTKLQVLVLSIVICLTAFFAYVSYAGLAIAWYYIVAVIFASFIIAIICCKGWDYIFEIWKRFYKKDLK